MSAALAEVKQELGPGAVILQARSFREKALAGSARQEVFEITAGRDARSAARPQRQAAVARPVMLPTKPAPDPRRQLLESPAGQNAAMAGNFRKSPD